MRTFSAGDIAERIKGRDESAATAVYRLQNWTKEGFVQAEGGKATGTGKPRLYGEAALFSAVLLQTLIDCTGIAAVKAAPMLAPAKTMIDMTATDQKYKGSILLIGRSRGNDGYHLAVGKMRSVAKMVSESAPEDTFTIIDLERLFASINAGEA